MADHDIEQRSADHYRRVTPDEFDAEWERCSGWLNDALEYARGSHLLEDVKALVMAGEVQFWPGEKCAVVTEIAHWPRLTSLHFWLCGGDLQELIEHLRPVIEAWGVTQGCSRFTTAGRPGWRRVMAKHGYAPAWESCAKDLTDEFRRQ